MEDLHPDASTGEEDKQEVRQASPSLARMDAKEKAVSPYRTSSPPEQEENTVSNDIGSILRYEGPRKNDVESLAEIFARDFEYNHKFPKARVKITSNETRNGLEVYATMSRPFVGQVLIANESDFNQNDSGTVADLMSSRMKALVPDWYTFTFRIGKTLRKKKP